MMDAAKQLQRGLLEGTAYSPPHASEWVFNPQVHIDTHGNLVALDESNFLWLETPSNTNALANSQLACTIKTPLDRGEALNTMCAAIEAFMPENTTSVLATMAACMMASTYQDIVSCCGCSGVPLLYGEPGSCKSEALHCGLALFALRVLTFITVKPLHLTCLMSSNRQQSPLPLMTSVRKPKTLGRNLS